MKKYRIYQSKLINNTSKTSSTGTKYPTVTPVTTNTPGTIVIKRTPTGTATPWTTTTPRTPLEILVEPRTSFVVPGS